MVQLWTDFNFLLMNLILTELLVSLFGIPVDALAAGRGGWDLGENVCVFIGFLLTFLGEKFAQNCKARKKIMR